MPVTSQPDGTALVREVIDYDFGTNDKHGIFRHLPGYDRAEAPDAGVGDPDDDISGIRVRSASAPDDVTVTDDLTDVTIKVGDPAVTVDGTHRYVLEYRIGGAVHGDRLAYDAIGTGWNVPIDSADIRLTAPYRLGDVRCFLGASGADDPCGPLDTGAAAVRVHVDDLGEREGVTVAATRVGEAGGSTALPAGGELTDRRSSWRTVWTVLGWGALGYVLGAVLLAAWARRAGRDRAWEGGGIEAVFGGPGLPSAPIADVTAERQVIMQFEPPRDLTPAQGGVVLSCGRCSTSGARSGWAATTSGSPPRTS